MIKKSLLLVSLSLMLQLANAIASANIDNENLELGQSLTLSITLHDASETPDLTPLATDFQIVARGTNSQISVINGRQSSHYTYNVTLLPKKSGKQFIPAIKVGNDSTAPIAINVTQGSANKSTAVAKNNLLAELIPSKSSSYVGVPIILKLKIYVGISVNNLSMEPFELPTAKIQLQGKPTQYQDVHNERNYQVVEQKYLLTPTEVGKITVPALHIHGEIPKNAGRPNGFFALVDQQPFVLTTEPVDLTVKPIPETMNPSNWLPASKLKISETWSPNTPKIIIGQNLTRSIILETDGVPVTTLPELKFTNPANVNAYPEKTANSETPNNNQLHASKTFTINYVATKAGKIEFPETVIKWWDLDKNQVQQAVLPATSFEVLPDKNKNTAASAVTVQPNKIITTQKPANSKWLYTAIATALIFIAALLISGYFIWRARTRKQHNLTANMGSTTITSGKDLFKALINACAEQDLKLTNQLLINWASLHWQHKIHTISEIKKLHNDNDLNRLIDQFNLALYRGQDFTEFAALATELTKLTKQKTIKPNKNKLKDFYPD